MRESAENARLRRETLQLLAQVEKQGLDIARAYQDGSGVAGRFSDFRNFIEKVDHFYVFVDLVEDRLPRFDHDKRAQLKRHLADIRWRIVIVEVDTTQIFLVRIGESSQPWPLGSQQFLQRRLDRLSEIDDWYDAFGEVYNLPPLGEAMVRAVEDLLRAQLPKASALSDFSADATAHKLVRPDEVSINLDRGGARAAQRPLQQPALRVPATPFRIREMDGRFYAERDGIAAVTEACRMAHLTLDDLARQMGMSRPSLVLILNGTDPMARGAMEELRGFVSRHGGSNG